MSTKTQISQLPPAITPLVGTEQIPLDQGGVTSRVSASQFTGSVFTINTNGLVPAPRSVSGRVLSDNGTWVTPPGGAITWTQVSNPLPAPTITPHSGVITPGANLFGVAYGNGLWVASAKLTANPSVTAFLTSPDGVTWTEHNVAITVLGSGLYFVGNAFFTLNNSGVGNLIRSTDGVTWTQVLVPTSGELVLPPAWDGTHYAIPESRTTNWHISTDGVTWTTVNGAGFTDTFNSNFAYGSFGGQNVWMVAMGTSSDISVVAVSTDITAASGWTIGNATLATGDLENTLFSTQQGAMLYGPPLQVSYFGYDSWNDSSGPSFGTAATGPGPVAYGGDMVCIVGTNGGQVLAQISSDGGISWNFEPMILPVVTLGDLPVGVAYGQGKFIAITSFGTMLSYTPPT